MEFLRDFWPFIAGVVGILGVGGVVGLIVGWPLIAGLLTGTTLGRWFLAAVIFGFALLLYGLAMKRTGANAERLRQAARRAVAIQDRIKSDEIIRTMPIADRRKRLAKWMR